MGQMDRVIIWTAPAKNDIQQITIYWNNRNKSNTYALKLRSIIREKLAFIKAFPFIGIITEYPNVRCFIIKDYKLFYLITDESIIVLRFWDTRQNPNKLKV
jgi:toxin YoeB